MTAKLSKGLVYPYFNATYHAIGSCMKEIGVKTMKKNDLIAVDALTALENSLFPASAKRKAIETKAG